MREIAYTKRFRQDYKRFKKRGWDVRRLEAIVDSLARGQPLPPKARPHKLSGNFKEAWDLHLAGDWILIYEISEDPFDSSPHRNTRGPISKLMELQ